METRRITDHVTDPEVVPRHLVLRRPHSERDIVGRGERAFAKYTRNELLRLEAETILKAARVKADGVVLAAKMDELDDLTRRTIMNRVTMSKLAQALADDDIILADELQRIVKLNAAIKVDLLTGVLD